MLHCSCCHLRIISAPHRAHAPPNYRNVSASGFKIFDTKPAVRCLFTVAAAECYTVPQSIHILRRPCACRRVVQPEVKSAPPARHELGAASRLAVHFAAAAAEGKIGEEQREGVATWCSGGDATRFLFLERAHAVKKFRSSLANYLLPPLATPPPLPPPPRWGP